MQFSKHLVLFATIGLTAATDTIWVTNTVYTCPCSSTLSTSRLTHDISSSPKSSVLTSLHVIDSFTHSVAASASVKSSSPSSLVSSKTSASVSSARATHTGNCIALGADCTDATVDHGCCLGTTCNEGLITPICVAEDGTGTGGKSSAANSPALTTSIHSSSPSASVTPPKSCIALGADCTDATVDHGCCLGTTCNEGLITPICVAED